MPSRPEKGSSEAAAEWRVEKFVDSDTHHHGIDPTNAAPASAAIADTRRRQPLIAPTPPMTQIAAATPKNTISGDDHQPRPPSRPARAKDQSGAPSLASAMRTPTRRRAKLSATVVLRKPYSWARAMTEARGKAKETAVTPRARGLDSRRFRAARQRQIMPISTITVAVTRSATPLSGRIQRTPDVR